MIKEHFHFILVEKFICVCVFFLNISLYKITLSLSFLLFDRKCVYALGLVVYVVCWCIFSTIFEPYFFLEFKNLLRFSSKFNGFLSTILLIFLLNFTFLSSSNSSLHYHHFIASKFLNPFKLIHFLLKIKIKHLF